MVYLHFVFLQSFLSILTGTELDVRLSCLPSIFTILDNNTIGHDIQPYKVYSKQHEQNQMCELLKPSARVKKKKAIQWDISCRESH